MSKAKTAEQKAADKAAKEAAKLGGESKAKGSVVVKFGKSGEFSREFKVPSEAKEFAEKREKVHGDKVSVE